MELKDISRRLEIIKLSISVNDINTINLQSEHLKKLNNIKINEIITLLENKNYRQALYLIKKFKEDNNLVLDQEAPIESQEQEYVLNVDDMLKMSPVAQESINQYRDSTYSADDIKAFSQNISTRVDEPPVETEKTIEKEVLELPEEEDATPDINSLTYAQEEPTKEDAQEEKELDNAIKDANQDTPLDEISSQIMSKKAKRKKREKVVSSYKTLRAKFARKDKKEDNNTPKKEKKSLLNRVKSIKKSQPKQEKAKNSSVDTNVKSQESIEKKSVSNKQPTQQVANNKDEKKDEIYPPIPHIENKFRQAFVEYPPKKESEIWVEEVAKFLKYISTNSYTDSDIYKFLDEYKHYLDNNDIARASQFLLLAGSTDAKYPQFLLARELFKGTILKRNIKKSHQLMSYLANGGYPDAICDLGQFYEYGIGMPENKKTALKLYEKAFELGLQRATKHINRVKESQAGLLSVFKKIIK
jgi:hypothetical protein